MAVVATAVALVAILLFGIQAISIIVQGSRLVSLASDEIKGQHSYLEKTCDTDGEKDVEAVKDDEATTATPSSTTLTSKFSLSSRPPYERRPSPGKGFGLFATRRIPKYARVLVEKPQFVIVPPFRPSSLFSTTSNLMTRIQASFDSLPPDEQAFYDSCHEHRFLGEPANGRLFYIFRSNAFCITPVDGVRSHTEGNTSYTKKVRWGMFPRMAQINHSCQPNVASLWLPSDSAINIDDESTCAIVWAIRDIAPGEEILISYVSLLQDTTARQQSLDQYGFLCNCSSCSQARSGYSRLDERRVYMGALYRRVQDFLAGETGIDYEPQNGNCFDSMKYLLRHLRDKDTSLTGYLPRAYRMAAELSRLATDNNAAVCSAQMQLWAAEEQILVHRLLSTYKRLA